MRFIEDFVADNIHCNIIEICRGNSNTTDITHIELNLGPPCLMTWSLELDFAKSFVNLDEEVHNCHAR